LRDRDPAGSTEHIGGPHTNVLPSVFADGHAQNIPYTYREWAQIWAWNNTTPVELP
jgi:hypothetical protein